MAVADFAVTWDYRCPFARIAHEHVLDGLEAGAPWDVTFSAFSLSQSHVEPGEPDVWDDPARTPDLLALLVGIVVRDRFPERFLGAHRALFAARHDRGLDVRREDVLREVLAGAGVDADAVFAEVEAGWPLEVLRKEHESAVADHAVFGVPTFVVGNSAAFVRLMSRPGDADEARRTVERVVDMLGGWPDLNEFRHTTVGR